MTEFVFIGELSLRCVFAVWPTKPECLMFQKTHVNLLHSTQGLHFFTWIVSRYLSHKLSAPQPENKTPLSILVYFGAAPFCFWLPPEVFLSTRASPHPFLSSHCCALQNVCSGLFLCVGPRVFLGMCCNLDGGGSETAFVSSDSGGSVMCGRKGRRPNNPFFGDLFYILMRPGLDSMSARVRCIMDSVRGVEKVTWSKEKETNSVRTQMRL